MTAAREKKSGIAATLPSELYPTPEGNLPKLVGLFAHTFDAEGYISHQGHIVAHVHDDLYLVEWFSWMMGEGTHCELVSLRDMKGWHFYYQHEWFVNVGNELSKRNGERIRSRTAEACSSQSRASSAAARVPSVNPMQAHK